MKYNKYIIFIAIVSSLLFLISCTKQTETPTKGNLKLYVDESVINLIKAERDSFMVLYPDAKLEIIPINTTVGINKVLNNETNLFISSRSLNNEERTLMDKKNLNLELMPFCMDGLAVIVSNSSEIKDITIENLENILSGRSKKFTVYIPAKESGVYYFLKDNLVNSEPVGATVLNSENDVIVKIKSNPNAIGVVDYNMIRDSSDVRILSVGILDSKKLQTDYFQPNPADFLQNNYPLTRKMYIIFNESSYGLANGFVAFLTSYEGQKIVLSQNLAPLTVPVKLVSNQGIEK